MNIGKIIRETRVKNGIKQVDFANKIQCTQPHVSLIERGIKVPSFDLLLKICEALNLTLTIE
jgi:transcriptional regulator with XRE-family HTH domain